MSATDRRPDARDRDVPGGREDWIELASGVELHVVDWTDGSRRDPALAPFVLVHGLASNARLWDGVGRRLAAAGHRVVAVDQRGHGRSSKPDDGYDMATVADDLHLLIGALGIRRPVVAGQSWGGNVVLELAFRHPDDIAAIVCVDGGFIDLRQRFPEWDDAAATPGSAAPRGDARWTGSPRGSNRRRPTGPTRAAAARSPTSRCSTTAPLPRGSPSTATCRCCAGCGSTSRRVATPRSTVPVAAHRRRQRRRRVEPLQARRARRRSGCTSRRPRRLVQSRPPRRPRPAARRRGGAAPSVRDGPGLVVDE